MIEQLARVHTEKSSLVDAHAESMRNVLTRSLELEALMDMQAADYLSLQNQLIESDGAASSAELRACVSEQALQALKCEYDEAQGASRREIAKICEAFDELKQECADLKESSQSQFSAALKKDTEFTVTIKGLQLDLQNSFQNNSVNSLRASQLEEEVKDLVMKNNLLRSALEQCQSKLSEAEKEKSLFLTAHTKTHQTNEVNMISSISGENMEGQSELAQPLDEIISGISSPARAMDSANASVQSSLSNVRNNSAILTLHSPLFFSPLE
jgi:galactitol-specific phosphotransferase system IIB component